MFKNKRDESSPLRFEIKHNKILEVEKFDSKEEGIISDGLDCLGNEIYIKNLDIGKAKELMRVVIEDEYSERRKIGMILFILISGILIAGAIVFFIFSGEKSESNIPVVPFLGTQEQIQTATETQTQTETETETQTETETETETEAEKEKTEMETYFEMETLKLANASEKTALSIENQNLKAQVVELQSEKTKLEEKVKNLEEESKKYNDLNCEIGAQVREKCIKLNSEGEKNDCAQLFLKASLGIDKN